MIQAKIIKLLASIGLVLCVGVSGSYGISKIKNPVDNGKVVQEESKVKSKESDLAKVEKPQESKDTEAKTENLEKKSIDSNTSTNIKIEENRSDVNNGQASNGNTTEKQSDDTVVNNSGDNTSKPNNYMESQNTQQPEAKNNSEASSDSYVAEIEQIIFQKVNQERAAAGLSALSYNGTMEHYARIKSKDMGDRGYFDHANPEGQMITAQMKADGVSYSAWGENIAYIQGVNGNANLANQFMTNWMNSPGHRANILSGNFSSIGVGVYKVGNTYYATQEFYR
ncbi:CAP domain-containing protein [Clostridium carnis]